LTFISDFRKAKCLKEEKQARKSGMPGPIRHIVMWRLRGDTAEERAAARLKVKDAFEGLKGLIKGLNHIEVGLDVSDVDYACDVVLVSEFADRAALKAYATHPEHLRVREELGDLRIGRFQVDYPIEEASA
jgi:hypothetical protein